jgi:hypothetical protein
MAARPSVPADETFSTLEHRMKATSIAVAALALGLMAATPARADMGDITFNMIFEMADKDRNSMVTKQEFLDAMGKAYDMKMAKMKAGKDAGTMIKGNAMTKDGVKALINDIHSGA